MNKRNFTLLAIVMTSALALSQRISGLGPLEAQAQEAATPTPGEGAAYITNTFEGEPSINVRTGPSTILYPIPCGSLSYGASAPALGTSPAHEWVQIAYPGCPGDVGWVYAANATLTGSVRIVEPPPTPLPLATVTIDPTLQAAFQIEPTETRLPTFTAPPPLLVPTFAEASPTPSRRIGGTAIVTLFLLGGVVLLASSIRRR
jgi:uncharacterized protein YraI